MDLLDTLKTFYGKPVYSVHGFKIFYYPFSNSEPAYSQNLVLACYLIAYANKLILQKIHYSNYWHHKDYDKLNQIKYFEILIINLFFGLNFIQIKLNLSIIEHFLLITDMKIKI